MPAITTLFHVYGQDLQLSPSGGLLLAQDELGPNGTPTASLQHLVRLVLTSPRLFDQNGRPISRGDDIFNPTFGAGLPERVDELVTDGLLNSVRAQILNAIANDPQFARLPAPTVVFEQSTSSELDVYVTATTVAGQIVATPALPLRVGG